MFIFCPFICYNEEIPPQQLYPYLSNGKLNRKEGNLFRLTFIRQVDPFAGKYRVLSKPHSCARGAGTPPS